MKRLIMKENMLKDERGMTLIEVLIAALLTLIIGAAALGFYVTQHNSWLVQEDVSEMQQNIRVALDEISKNIRQAGFGVPSPHPTILVQENTLTIFYREVNSNYARAYAEDIESIQFNQADKLITISIVAREGRKDPEYTGDGYRRRTISSRARVRNRI